MHVLRFCPAPTLGAIARWRNDSENRTPGREAGWRPLAQVAWPGQSQPAPDTKVVPSGEPSVEAKR